MESVAGIDRASEHHDVRISAADGTLVCERRVSHDERGIAELIRPPADHGVCRVAIERPEGLVATRVGLANQPRAEPERSWPGALGPFADLDSPISLAVVLRYPGPGDAAGLGPARMAAFLARNSCRGRQSPASLVERLRAAPRAVIGPAEAEARRGIVLGLVGALSGLVAQIAQLTSAIAGAVRAHADGRIFLGLFVDPKSTITAATPPAEMGDARERHPTRQAPCADAGMSPVAIESGGAGRPSFGAPATTVCARPSASSPRPPATAPPGPATSTRARGPGGPTIPTRSGSWAAPGCASFIRSGSAERPTTRPATATSSASSRQGADTGSALAIRGDPCPVKWTAPEFREAGLGGWGLFHEEGIDLSAHRKAGRVSAATGAALLREHSTVSRPAPARAGSERAPHGVARVSSRARS